MMTIYKVPQQQTESLFHRNCPALFVSGRRLGVGQENSFPALAMEVALAISATLGATTLCKRWHLMTLFTLHGKQSPCL